MGQGVGNSLEGKLRLGGILASGGFGCTYRGGMGGLKKFWCG